MSAFSLTWEMTKTQYNCEVIQPENFKQVMDAFSIALILSVPGTNLRICAFLQVVCAVETEFLPLCASWPEQKTQAGKKRHFSTVSASCVVITSGRKIAAQRKVTDEKKRKAQIREKSQCDKKTRKHIVLFSGVFIFGPQNILILENVGF